MPNDPLMLNWSCHLKGTGNDPSDVGVLFTQAVVSPLLDTVSLTTALPLREEAIGRLASGGLPADVIPFDDSIGSRIRKFIESEPEPETVRFTASSLIPGVASQSVSVLVLS